MFAGRERPRLPRLPRRLRRHRPARLRPAEQGRGEDRRRRPGARPGAARPRRHRPGLDRRLPRPLGAGQPLGLLVHPLPPGGAGAGALRRGATASAASPCSASTSRTTATTRSPSCASYDVAYPQLRSVGDERSAAFGSTGVPENFLVDPRGRLALIWRGPVDESFLRGAGRADRRRAPMSRRGDGGSLWPRRRCLRSPWSRRQPGAATPQTTHHRRRRRSDVPDLRHPAGAGRIAAGAARESPSSNG